MTQAALLGCCGGGGGGLCISIEQAPGLFDAPVPPTRAMTSVPIGTKVVSFPPQGPALQIGTNPVTGKPTYPAPVSSGGSVGIIAKKETYNPAPTPAVGIIAPPLGCDANFCFDFYQPAPAPKTSNWKPFAIFAAVIVGLWILAGASLRRFL